MEVVLLVRSSLDQSDHTRHVLDARETPNHGIFSQPRYIMFTRYSPSLRSLFPPPHNTLSTNADFFTGNTRPDPIHRRRSIPDLHLIISCYQCEDERRGGEGAGVWGGGGRRRKEGGGGGKKLEKGEERGRGVWKKRGRWRGEKGRGEEKDEERKVKRGGERER